MRKSLLGFTILLVALLALNVPLFGHHGSNVLYDMDKKVTMTGLVTAFQYRNPHVYIQYDVKDDKGHIVNWNVETYAPIVMVKRDNWTRDTLKVGDEIVVTLWPAKSGAPRGFLAKLVMPTGVTLYGLLWQELSPITPSGPTRFLSASNAENFSATSMRFTNTPPFQIG